jgi:hypothetical protein
MKGSIQNYQYKLCLLYIKYIPILCVVLQLIYLALYILGYDLYILVTISGISIIPFIIIYKSIEVFKFCVFQKLVLIYNTLVDFIISIKICIPYTLFLLGVLLLFFVIKHRISLNRLHNSK